MGESWGRTDKHKQPACLCGLVRNGLVRNVCAGLQADKLEFYVRFKREEIRLAIHPLGPMLGPRAEVLV